MKKEYLRPELLQQQYMMDRICQLVTSPGTPADNQYGEDAKSRNEFEDFLSSQEGTKTNSLW